MPNTDEMNNNHLVNYQDYHVAFIDILGFSDLVKNSLSDGRALFKIMDSLYELDPHKIGKAIHRFVSQSSEFGFVQFSDSIVLYDEKTPNGFWRLVGIIIEIAMTLAQHGTLCRGGLTSGKLHVYKDEDGNQTRPIVFGPAFIEAYSLEASVAINPRVVLSRSAYDDLEQYSASEPWSHLASNYIRRDIKDGVAYIDVLRDIWTGLNSSSVDERDEAIALANVIREGLIKNLREHIARPQVFAKYYWFSMRYNELIKKRIAVTNYIEPIHAFSTNNASMSLKWGDYESDIPSNIRRG